MQEPNAEWVNQCLHGLSQGESILAVANQAIEQQPQHAIFYFFRGTEHAANGDYPLARHDFATALVLEPDFTMARLQYVFCCFVPELLPMVAVLIQPLLQSPQQAELQYGQALLALLQNDSAAFELIMPQLQQNEHVVPAVVQNLQQLGARLKDEALADDEETALADAGVSAVLLEIYQQKH